jgi:oligopeptide transport system substrate-binding protein
MNLHLSAPLPGARRRPSRRRLIGGVAAIAAVATLAFGAWRAPTAVAARSSVTILGASAASLDPAVQSDAGSAQVIAQIFEPLTVIDTAGVTQPALAASWSTQTDGKKITFHLRPNLAFSDGSALTAKDVVTSWMRVLDPDRPSELSSLLAAGVGACALR